MSASDKQMRTDPHAEGLPAEATAGASTDKLVVTIAPAFNDEDGFVPKYYYALQYRLVCLSFWERGNERRSFKDMIQQAVEKARKGCVFDPPPSAETPVEVLVDSKEMTARSPAVRRNWDKLIKALNDKRVSVSRNLRSARSLLC